MHTSVSGVADHLASNDGHAIRLAREAVQDLGNTSRPKLDASRQVRPPLFPAIELESIVPSDPRQTYDMREVIARIVDGSDFREFKQEYGKTVITVGIFPSLDLATSDCRALPRYMGIQSASSPTPEYSSRPRRSRRLTSSSCVPSEVSH